MYFTFLLLNQEHGVNKERSQSIHSVYHSKRTPHVASPKRPWCGGGGCVCGGGGGCKKVNKKSKKVFLAHRAHLAVQYSIGPCLKV